jgi:hypothetical protein
MISNMHLSLLSTCPEQTRRFYSEISDLKKQFSQVEMFGKLLEIVEHRCQQQGICKYDNQLI